MNHSIYDHLLTAINWLDENKIDLLARHWLMVHSWNSRINLTAITSDEHAAWYHYRDSLEAIQLLPNGSVVDIGSGAGFPGIPLAIAEPEREVVLVEPRRKRASFLNTVKARLGLANVSVLQTRSESQPDALFAAAVTRATFSCEADLVACLDWVEADGVLIAFRGDVESPNATIHRYELMGEPRTLAVWRK
ncbi:MAG: 16S rRNA (guanine(527)-N(7))-methyltransferase RsmG [Deltaproteobacteria bacterium RIFOXYB12_FULL_58_9]|nr:MAG: 16S rRNA (guanine(527)-N(7))-methyltransferase RsmG [Deltaproteobacteria bacterium RIFOXYB12_FULL_58_9]